MDMGSYDEASMAKLTCHYRMRCKETDESLCYSSGRSLL